MIRLLVLAAAAAAAVSVLVVTATAGTAKNPQLIGTVGKNNAFKITLTSNGKVVKTLKAGTYTFVIHDDSNIHNYKMDGPGKEWSFTTVPFVGTKTKTIKLTAGKYKAYCQPHESSMFQKFTVT